MTSYPVVVARPHAQRGLRPALGSAAAARGALRVAAAGLVVLTASDPTAASALLLGAGAVALALASWGTEAP